MIHHKKFNLIKILIYQKSKYKQIIKLSQEANF